MVGFRSYTMLITRIRSAERGASAIFIAFTMVLLMGMAALVIDATGAGFNERRQSQAAADTSVMAGALGFVLQETDVDKVRNALEIARSNLRTDFSDAEWQAAWESCTDPDIGAVDLGLTNPIAFSPMPNPFAAPTTATLECVSRSSSFMRVVLPDQFVGTTFGRIIGFDSITTGAEAVARIEPREGHSGLLPFGIPGGSSAGEICLSTSPSGTAEPPCQGPSAGGFGTINSEFFGDFFGTATCDNPGAAELEQNIALGIDHFVDVWPNALGVTEGSPHPGDVAVGGYPDVSYDQCRLVGGVKQPQQPGHEFPPNAHRVDTGFPSGPVENGLISDNTYLGDPSLLQNTGNPTQDVVKRRQGANNTVYELDDRGPWEYLVGSFSPECTSSTYETLTTTEQKIILFNQCLVNYASAGATVDIFEESILESPRFAWAPQYWHAASTSGVSWQPVKTYRMVFLGGLWFNCSAGSCGALFYPDEADENGNAEICDASGPSNCSLLSLNQLSAWLLPDEAVPASVSGAFPGGSPTPFQTTLYR
jgi:hypothetical protein